MRPSTASDSFISGSICRPGIALCMVLLLLTFVVLCSAQDSKFEDEFGAGKNAAMQNDYAAAVTHFTAANLLRQNKCSDCYVWTARSEMAMGKFDQALQDATLALSVADDDVHRCNAQLYRGVILGRENKLPDAETAFQAASAANPQCTECRFNLGLVLLRQSKDAEGVEVLKTVAPQFAGTPRGRELERFIADPSRIRKDYAPEFSATLKTGQEVNLDTLQGKVVLLDFWGTWCQPCRVSLPALKDLASKVDPAKVAIVSIDEYDPRPQWEQFTEANGMNWAQVYDGDRALHTAFRVDGFPRYFILSKSGIILAEFKGWNQNGEATISDAINRALKVSY